MTVCKLKFMPYAQAHVTEDGNTITLVSYRTEVIRITGDWFECTGLYSMTTRKHISAFMREYYPTWGFQLAKELAGSGKKINLVTGEVR